MGFIRQLSRQILHSKTHHQIWLGSMLSRFLWLNFTGKGKESLGFPVIEGNLWSPLKSDQHMR